MIDSAALLADTRKQVNALVEDLRANADRAVLDAEYSGARAAGRTSLPQPQWAEGEFAQVAVSWVLGCVFVRFCEDNRLVSDALISGPGNRRDLAREHRAEYLRQNPAHDDRDWLRHIFTIYRGLPATGDIFGDHNPLWLLQPSADGARELVQAFQRIDPETGEISHDFTDPEWNTRFLGDMYQDLSDHAKKQFALLQTPVFVEEFILDHTLEPAIRTFGLKDTDLIDPTCGSGHFILGAFDRLFRRWQDAEPATNPRELARRAADAVAGVDINPFAVAIARFRLLLAALRAGGDRRLADAPIYPVNLAVGDSLLHSYTQLTLSGIGRDDDLAAAAAHGYTTEDLEATRVLLSRRWAAVVGNPPYIVVRDPALKSLYRKRYPSCRGKFSLGVPFTERFWQLGRVAADADSAGFVGMITAASFMRGDMGKTLVESWIPTHDLTHVVDTNGTYIPGHGTPTVILFGRCRRAVGSTVRVVMSIQGEPSPPSDPALGLVWTSIATQVANPGFEDDFISVVDFPRSRLASHPWSIGGGGAAELKERLDASAKTVLGEVSESIGITAFTLEDDAYLMSAEVVRRHSIAQIRELVEGDKVRDWSVSDCDSVIFPYSPELQPLGDEIDERSLRWLWPRRSCLKSSIMFEGKTKIEVGLHWTEFGRLSVSKFRSPLALTFAHVATHNHFAFVRDGRVFSRTAPIVKLPVDASEADYLNLLGLLNSSTAAFWIKQVCHNKGSTVDARGARQSSAPFENFYNHDGKKLAALPLPSRFPSQTSTLLDLLARDLADARPRAIAQSGVPTADLLSASMVAHESAKGAMIGLQEQLDWEVYRCYGLVEEDLIFPDGEPSLALGQRAFEIALARRMADAGESTTWFRRHGSTPTTELPAHWASDYRALVERRISVIEGSPEIGLIERPEYKRRWNAATWQDQQVDALRDWLLDRLESAQYWRSSTITSTARLAALVRTDADFMTVSRLYVGRDDVDVAALVLELVKAESVPYLAALRFADAGLRKWTQWCEAWALQRLEDAGENVGDVPVPPRYVKADFTGVAWSHRGKLDVPKERFVSYPGAESDIDRSLVIGWAGWNHLERARALATFYLSSRREGRDLVFLTPLLAGLAELVPWLLQGHTDSSQDPALDRPGSQIAGLLDSELRGLHLSISDLEGWRPVSTRRGRKRA